MAQASEIESITKEVLFFFPPHGSLQVSTINLLSQLVSDLVTE
jgi:hypothetical protein